MKSQQDEKYAVGNYKGRPLGVFGTGSNPSVTSKLFLSEEREEKTFDV